jgi:hypothetical protein
MNYLILAGIALYLLATAIDDDAMGWQFHRGGSWGFSTEAGDYRVRVRGGGEVDLAPDGSGVAALDDGGSLDVRMTRGRTERRVLFEGVNGTVEQKFFVGGDEQPWGPDADAFVAEIMPMVLRETGISVEERVAWLIANRGHAGLLDEIDLIGSDFAQRLYSVQYARSAMIADADFLRLMTLASGGMGSDFELRTTLTEVHDLTLPTDARFVALLAAGGSIGSDFEARTLLERLGPRLPSTPEAAAAYLDLARTIGSDFEMRLALRPVVMKADSGDDLVAGAIEVAGYEIGSDFELRMLLTDAAPRVGASDTLARAYTTAVAQIGSDFEHREALARLADAAELSPVGWRLLLESAQSIGGDFECSTLLTHVAPALPRDPEVITAYRDTLATIGGEFERNRAGAALVELAL